MSILNTRKMSILLDSGAFSAWTKKVDIDIDAYISFYFQYQKYIEYIVNLDIIPGEFGRSPSVDEVEISAKEGFKNYRYMLSKGVPKEKLIHVFHQGERFYWLKKMVDFGVPYIGLSPANTKATSSKIKWLDECMEYVTDTKGFPIVKFHGFAVTAVPIMQRYPWFSVDSTRCVKSAGFGKILFPVKENGAYTLSKTNTISVSFVSPKNKQEGTSFYSYTKEEQKEIIDYVESKGFKMGISEFDDSGNEVIIEKGLINSHACRTEFNVRYMLDVQRTIPAWPWAFKTKVLSLSL